MSFIFTKQDFDLVCPVLIEPKGFEDPRGIFYEMYKFSDFYKNGITEEFDQDNMSISRKHVFRGLHFQKKPKPQAKLVTVVKGAIFDIIVDLRKESSTFKKWKFFSLDEESKNILYVPSGFAHGFISIRDTTTIYYKCSNEFDCQYDCGVRWNDPELDINWPKQEFIISEKDRNLPFLKDILEVL
jgi:dTDP-4-dehydrorhamnose 3,5-epimerase